MIYIYIYTSFRVRVRVSYLGMSKSLLNDDRCDDLVKGKDDDDNQNEFFE